MREEDEDEDEDKIKDDNSFRSCHCKYSPKFMTKSAMSFLDRK